MAEVHKIFNLFKRERAGMADPASGMIAVIRAGDGQFRQSSSRFIVQNAESLGKPLTFHGLCCIVSYTSN